MLTCQSTWWERLGDRSADGYAKEGADLHSRDPALERVWKPYHAQVELVQRFIGLSLGGSEESFPVTALLCARRGFVVSHASKPLPLHRPVCWCHAAARVKGLGSTCS